MALKVKWSLETQQDLAAYHGIDDGRAKLELLAKLYNPNYDPASMNEYEKFIFEQLLNEESDA